MMLQDLFIVDFDELSRYSIWATEHPELESAPAERTEKGVRVYFLRCRAVEAAGLYDCEMIHSPSRKKADIGRRNEVVVETGSGDWLPCRSLVELELPTMSMDLLWKIVCYSGRGQ